MIEVGSCKDESDFIVLKKALEIIRNQGLEAVGGKTNRSADSIGD